MKKITLFLLMFVVASQAFSSMKKDKVDPKDAKIDSLTNANTALTLQLDSISKKFDKYFVVYSTVKEKVFKYDFDPAKTGLLIDSLKTTRDSTFTGLTAETTSLEDSLAVLKTENASLLAKIESLSEQKEVDISKMASDLKQLKELLDAGILSQEDFDKQKNAVLEKYQ